MKKLFTTNLITGKTYYHGFDTETTAISKEEKTMTGTKRAQGAVEVTDFELNGTRYTMTRTGYYYKKVDGKQIRISKAEYEEAWNASGEAERQAREVEAAKSDKEAEKKFNKGEKKPRRSKDIAHESNGVTLTAKQVDFIRHMPDTCFYEHGLESLLWVDVLAEEIGGQFADKPMTIGAMISTLREKDVIFVARDESREGKPKYIGFTDLGKKIAVELGLN